MRAVTFTIKLLEPMLATGLEGDPNSVVSLDYVPGSVIRGAIINRYLKRKGHAQLDLSNDTEYSLFFNGAVRYLNSYPVALQEADNRQERRSRTLPIPLSWYVLKDAEGPENDGTTDVHDLCFKSPEEAEEAFGGNPHKPLANSRPFFCFFKNQIITTRTERRVAVHTQRDPRKGRAIEDVGQVFSYDSVAAGAGFSGAIIFDDKAEATLVSEVKDLLDDAEIRLGRSRTGGYGRAQITEVSHQDDWQEVTTNLPITIAAGERFTITLLSNALIRDQHGQYQADLPVEVLQKYFGVVQPLAYRSHKRAELVGGFNRKWGLPLPQTVSLKAGSVFVFKALTDITQKQFQDLVDRGIGERRVEGFGRIAVKLNSADTLDWRAPEKEPLAVAPSLPSDERLVEHRLSKRIAERILRQRLDAKLVELVNLHAIENPPPNSQIARLRSVLREALRGDSKQPMVTFFEQTRKTAQRHFDKARVRVLTGGTFSLQYWITETLNASSRFDVPPVTLGNENGAVQMSVDELKLEYHLRLIDGVLARATKEEANTR